MPARRSLRIRVSSFIQEARREGRGGGRPQGDSAKRHKAPCIDPTLSIEQALIKRRAPNPAQAPTLERLRSGGLPFQPPPLTCLRFTRLRYQ